LGVSKCRHAGAKKVTVLEHVWRAFFFEDDGAIDGDDCDSFPTNTAFVQCYECGKEVRVSAASASGPRWARQAAERVWKQHHLRC
jgi:hypothetical protein